MTRVFSAFLLLGAWAAAACSGDVAPDAAACGGCAADARCVSRAEGGSACVCDEGFFGDGKKTCEKLLAGAECGGVCASGAACVRGADGQPACRCPAGTAGDGRRCDAVAPSDSCTACAADARCVQRAAGAVCACNEGFSGNGKECYPVQDEQSCGGCGENASCVREAGGQPRCRCEPGTWSDGSMCRRATSCSDHNGGCHPWALCTDSAQGPQCDCRYGSVGDGWSCLPPPSSWLRVKGSLKLTYKTVPPADCSGGQAAWNFDLVLPGDGTTFSTNGTVLSGVFEARGQAQVVDFDTGQMNVDLMLHTWFDFCPGRSDFYFSTSQGGDFSWQPVPTGAGGASLVWFGRPQAWFWDPDDKLRDFKLEGTLAAGFGE